jgi:phage terminase large subunit GpA-like protein
MPIKGFVSHQKNAVDPLIGKQQKLKLNAGIKGKCTVQFIGVNAGKDELANCELLTIAGEKRMSYIRGCGYDLEYFKGLLSEKRINGKWIAPQKGDTHNEPLDCRVYAMAAANYYMNRYYLTGLDREDEMAKKKRQNQNQPITESPKVDPVFDAQQQESPQIADAQPQQQPQPVKKFKHL